MGTRELVYTIRLRRTTRQGSEFARYEAALFVDGDEFAKVDASSRLDALDGICRYVVSTEGFPTGSLDDPVEGLTLAHRMRAKA
jgi:hypothetical protein